MASTEWHQQKTQVMARLRRAEGQVRAVVAMVERDEECEQVVQQLSASRKALDRAFYDLIACMMQRELLVQGTVPQRQRKQLDHLRELLTRYG